MVLCYVACFGLVVYFVALVILCLLLVGLMLFLLFG